MDIHRRRLTIKLITAIFLLIFVAIAAIITSVVKTNIANNKTSIKIKATPKPIVRFEQIGFISKVYEEDEKRYLRFDDVIFLIGKEAIEAAKKEDNAIYENGEYSVLDDYYIFNEYDQYKTYIIDDNAALSVLDFYINPYSSTIDNTLVTYERFKEVVSQYDNILCYIYIENDVIVKVEGQYTP
jgi:hypothetical protein